MPFEVTIEVENEEQWRSAMRSAATGLDFALAKNQFLGAAGSFLQRQIVARTPAAYGTLRSAIGFEVLGDDVKIGVLKNISGPSSRLPAPEYARFVEEGRAPGNAPPPGVLRPWMDKVGFPGSEYALARSIAEKGTRPHPFLVPTLVDNEGRLLEMSKRYYQAALDRIAGRTGSRGFFGRVGAFLKGLFS